MRVFICAVLLIVVVFAAPHGKLAAEVSVGGDCYVKACSPRFPYRCVAQVTGTIYEYGYNCYEALTACGGCISAWGVKNRPGDLKPVTCPAQICGQEAVGGQQGQQRETRSRLPGSKAKGGSTFVSIFGIPTDPMTTRCREHAEALKDKDSRDDFNFRFIDMTDLELNDLAKKIGKQVETWPQIFIFDDYIGGCDDFERYAKRYLGLEEAKVGECSDTVTDTGATCADMKGWFTPHECDYDYFMNDGQCACMCPQAAAVGGNAQLKRINKALLEALKTMAN